MKNRVRYFGKAIFTAFFALTRMSSAIAFAAIIVLWYLPIVSSQSTDTSSDEKTPASASISAKGRGFPRVSLEDGREIVAASGQESGAPEKQMTFADFDSDGVADLVTVDASGSVKFYRGNVDAIFPNTEETNERKANGTFTELPFYGSSQTFTLAIAPDFFEAGDFNADGHQDILAAIRGDDRLYVSVGNGDGTFVSTTEFPLGGSITALATGEIGRHDGQTDVAVSVQSQKGPQLIVFEHPAGAFAYTPERIQLGASATAIVLGFLENDSFGDIAVAAGNQLTVIRGRGHVYPFDTVKDLTIRRPVAVVETRSMPFAIAGLVTGYFTERRGESLAILTAAGAIVTLDSPASPQRIKGIKPQNLRSGDLSYPVAGTSMRFSSFKLLNEMRPLGPGEALPSNVADASKLKADGPFDPVQFMREQTAEPATVSVGGSMSDASGAGERTRANFLKAISPTATEPLARWAMHTISQDSRFLNSANSHLIAKLIKVRVSDSGRDELAFVDRAASKIHLMVRGNSKRDADPKASEIISLDVDASPTAVMPMRLNPDALSDLVVLRDGSPTPSVVMTAPAATFTVTTTADEDDGSCGASCSLREAIDAANLSAGVDMINFTVGGTIRPTTQLPEIQSAVSIIGPSAGGAPGIEVKGNLAPDGSNGLNINAPNVVVRGLAINEFREDQPDPEEPGVGGFGLAIYNFAGSTFAAFNTVEGCYIGTDRTGALDQGNEAGGILIFDADNNTIGGTTAAARNVLSGNGDGHAENGTRYASGLSLVDARSNIIRGNYMGLAANGTAQLGNSFGLRVTGRLNEVGGDMPGAANVISGNRHLTSDSADPLGCNGIGVEELSLVNEMTGEWLTLNNMYKGNRIGTTANGLAAAGNCRQGLFASPRNSPFIGSITQLGRNTVSGNTEGGIICSPVVPIEFLNNDGVTRSHFGAGPSVPEGSCKVVGNNVGTDINGNFAIPNNMDRLYVPTNTDIILINFIPAALSVGNTDTLSEIGGVSGTTATSCTGFCNLVSGNKATDTDSFVEIAHGVTAAGEGTVAIYRNYVGTNNNGTAAIPNDAGVTVYSDSSRVGDVSTDMGGNESSLGNLISGNNGNPFSPSFIGYALEARTTLSIIRGNLMGTDRTGTTAIPNQEGMRTLGGAGAVIIGGTQTAARNIISGNLGTGITFPFFSGNSVPTVNNYIGVNVNGAPLGNGRDGVELAGTFDYIGDTGAGNIIANNGRNGIYVSASTARGNRIKYNSIYNNGALGIDLTADTTNPIEPDGVTENDCDDIDSGPHGLQNYPILTAPQFNGDGTVTVGGAFDSTPSTAFTLDFYSNSAADSSGYGEGETYVGSASVTTDASGIASFLWTSTVPVASSLLITATAYDIDGSTSEFSCIAGQCSITGANIEEQTKSAMETVGGGGCSLGFVVNVTTDESDPNPADGICDVDLGTTGSQCSLRAAIETTNAIAGTDFINFDIPGSGVQTITPALQLPAITEKVFINATTQPGYSTAPLIELQGSAAGPDVDGLVFAVGSDRSEVRGITINRFDSAGIRFQSNDNVVEKSYIGLGSDGTTTYPIPDGQAYGIVVSGARNRIGGDRADEVGNNYITGNYLDQIRITSANAVENKVVGNTIGALTNGTLFPGGTVSNGIVIEEASSTTTIGGNTLGDENEISGGGIAVEIKQGAHHNTIIGNTIWFSKIGIVVIDSSDNRIGGFFVNDNDTEGNLFDSNEIGVIIGGDEEQIGLVPSRNTKLFSNLFIVEDPEQAPEELTTGIVVENAEDTRIGLSEPGYSNGIFNQTNAGIVIQKEAVRTIVQRNRIGAGADGVLRPNKIGVRLAGSGSLVSTNVISGNTDFGVAINRLDDDDPIPTLNTLDGNYIGTNELGGTAQIPNGNGVLVDGRQNSITNNLISGNTDVGVDIRDNENTVTSNRIGTDDAGNIANRNGFGMLISSSANTVRANTVSGNVVGIAIGRDADTLPTIGVESNKIQGNTIGTNRAGTSALRNDTFGIVLFNGATNNSIGGLTSGDANVISGNGRYGIFIQLGEVTGATPPAQNRVQGNFIGTNITGTAAIANVEDGIIVDGATDTLIGGFGDDMPAARNVISGNGRHGIILRALRTRISGNYIGTTVDGTTPLGNVQNGIFISTGTGTTNIGGLEPNAGNTIAFNGRNGILAAADAGNNNIIDPNAIFANALMGIDLGDDGHTPNDPGDADTGPNNLQNYPELITRRFVNDELIIDFKVDSAPANSAYGTNGIYIEFFKADLTGEGERFIGSTFYTLADYQNGSPGIKTVNLGNINTLGITAADNITATATDANGNTSEFYNIFAPTAALVSVSGRVTTSGGQGIRNVSVSLTDSAGNVRRAVTNSFGNYRLDDIEAGQTVILAVASKRYVFTDPTRVLMVVEDIADADFVADDH